MLILLGRRRVQHWEGSSCANSKTEDYGILWEERKTDWAAEENVRRWWLMHWAKEAMCLLSRLARASKWDCGHVPPYVVSALVEIDSRALYYPHVPPTNWASPQPLRRFEGQWSRATQRKKLEKKKPKTQFLHLLCAHVLMHCIFIENKTKNMNNIYIQVHTQKSIKTKSETRIDM